MKESILKLIQQNNMRIDHICNATGLTPEEVDVIIAELVNERKIFLNFNNKYEAITDDCLIGVVEKTSKESCYVNVNDEKIPVTSDMLHTALKNDLVVVERLSGNSCSVRGILKRKNNRLVCEVKEWNNKLILVPFNGNCEVQLVTPSNLLKDLIVGDRVYVTLSNESSEYNDIVVRDIHKIGHFNDKFNDELAIAISKDFDIDFGDDAMREAEEIPKEVQESEKEDRVDLTDEEIFTIDSVHTKDMDDAISIKKLDNGNYQLGVHIADVAHYIKPGSALFKEALKRGTSVYLGDVVIPMIPSILSNGICSLNENSERLTKSCVMEINPKGKVVNYRIFDSVIRSKKKMTYEEVNDLFAGNSADESYLPFIQSLEAMRELSNILTKAKNKKGNLDFESSDIRIKKDLFNDDKILEFKKKNSGVSEKMIENFMVIANETVATDFYWRDLPFIYRTHESPEELRLEDTIDQIRELGLGKQLIKLQNAYGPKCIQSILKQYQDTPMYAVVSNLLLRSMAKAKYTTDNIGHFALALDSYCHFTSPIRRFPDLMVHTLINRFNNSKSKFNHLDRLHDELVEIASHSSYKERQANDAESDYLKLKMAEYMEEHKEEDFDGMILDIDKDRVFIKLNNNVKCLLDNLSDFAASFDIDPKRKALYSKFSKQQVKLGTMVSTRVTRVDIPQKKVYLDIRDIIKENANQPKKLELK